MLVVVGATRFLLPFQPVNRHVISLTPNPSLTIMKLLVKAMLSFFGLILFHTRPSSCKFNMTVIKTYWKF